MTTAMMAAIADRVHDVWHVVAIGLGLLLSVLATGHVVLNKRDTRAAIAWVPRQEWLRLLEA